MRNTHDLGNAFRRNDEAAIKAAKKALGIVKNSTSDLDSDALKLIPSEIEDEEHAQEIVDKLVKSGMSKEDAAEKMYDKIKDQSWFKTLDDDLQTAFIDKLAGDGDAYD
jgi:hypothetical protein